MRFRGYRIGKLLIVKRGPQPAHLLVGRLSLRFGHARKGARANMQSGQCGDRHRNQGNHNGARDDRSFVDKHHHGIAIPNSGIWFGEDRMPDRSSAGCKASRTWDQIVVVAAASTDRSVTLVPCLRASREVNAISAISES